MDVRERIDQLVKERDEHRGKARRIDSSLRILYEEERARIKRKKEEDQKNARRVKHNDKQSLVSEMNRLRVLLADSMKANGKTNSEIETALRMRISGLRVYRMRLQRQDRR